jgi:hypothetical protein
LLAGGVEAVQLTLALAPIEAAEIAAAERHLHHPCGRCGRRAAQPNRLCFCRKQLCEVLVELTDRIGVSAK